jgi:hypothetical protein
VSKAEILAELPKLKAEDRILLFERLCELQEKDLLQGIGPSADERKLLDDALAEFERDGDSGLPWREVLPSLRGGDQV